MKKIFIPSTELLKNRYSEGYLNNDDKTPNTVINQISRNSKKINKMFSLIFPALLLTACSNVLEDTDIVYAEGLSHDASSTAPFAVPLALDMYYPDDESTNRPVFMFIHGGGFKGGTKTKPEIVDMAKFYASRGWVFASVDYRTGEELCDLERMPQCEAKLTEMTKDEKVAFYKGIAPQEWLEYAICSEEDEDTSNCAEDLLQIQQSIAMYAAQRDAKAALRWIVANASTYDIDTNHITVGGASAGSITAVALGISDQDDFRDEMSIDDDPTLSTTNLDEMYEVQSIVHFWGSNQKLKLFEGVYGVDPYDANDPELFMAHGDGEDLLTPYEGALELQEMYDSLGVHSELVTLEGRGHGAWNAKVDGKGLSELSYDFLVERQGLNLE